MAHDAREQSNKRLVPRQALLMRGLTGLIQAAAKQLDPPVLEEMVRSVGTQLGRQALSEHWLLRQAGGWLRGYTWAECLKEIGEQFGWTLRVAVESEGVIRVRVLACRFGESDEFGSYLCEFGSGLFGGAMAAAIGEVKVCMSRCSETPPRNCVLTIYFRPSKKSLAAPGTVYPRISDLAARGAEKPLDSMPSARLTSREIQILQHIAHGLSDKEIAERLQLSVRTVENHAARIRKKLSVGNRAALVRFALRTRLVDSP
jgi:DNA-binding CsgD family transcriptional regulator